MPLHHKHTTTHPTSCNTSLLYDPVHLRQGMDSCKRAPHVPQHLFSNTLLLGQLRVYHITHQTITHYTLIPGTGLLCGAPVWHTHNTKRQPQWFTQSMNTAFRKTASRCKQVQACCIIVQHQLCQWAHVLCTASLQQSTPSESTHTCACDAFSLPVACILRVHCQSLSTANQSPVSKHTFVRAHNSHTCCVPRVFDCFYGEPYTLAWECSQVHLCCTAAVSGSSCQAGRHPIFKASQLGKSQALGQGMFLSATATHNWAECRCTHACAFDADAHITQPFLKCHCWTCMSIQPTSTHTALLVKKCPARNPKQTQTLQTTGRSCKECMRKAAERKSAHTNTPQYFTRASRHGHTTTRAVPWGTFLHSGKRQGNTGCCLFQSSNSRCLSRTAGTVPQYYTNSTISRPLDLATQDSGLFPEAHSHVAASGKGTEPQ
jgi:hypothetical protein